MNNKRRLVTGVALGGLAAVTLAYVRRLLYLKPAVSEVEAIYNGHVLLQSGRKVLAVTAHPDDLEIFMGATLAMLSNRGRHVAVIDVSDGEKGVRRRNLAPIRRQEQRRAAQVLGLGDLRFLHLPDLHLAEEESLQPILQQAMLDVQPDIVFAFDPDLPLHAIDHPDHVSVGRTVREIARGLPGQPQVYYYATRRPDTMVDIANHVDHKIAAVRCHKSQLRFADQLYDPLVKLLARYTARSTILSHAECFRRET